MRQRIRLNKILKEKNPDRIAVVFRRYKKTDVKLAREKFLAPLDIRISRLVEEAKTLSPIAPYLSLFFFVEKYGNMVAVPLDFTVERLYERYQSPDGFLYLWYTTENAFG